MKIIALAISDIHLANWKQFNLDEYRLKITYNLIKKIIKIARDNGVPILNPGDFIDHPKYLENVVMKYVSDIAEELRAAQTSWYGINGNHDLSRINTYTNPQSGYMTHLSKMMPNQFECMDFRSKLVISNKPFILHGIPYTNHNIGFIEALKDLVKKVKNKPDYKHILMIHRDLAGAVEPDGKVVKKDADGDNDLKKLFKNFDLVISGHIHKPQRIKALGKNVYMLGAPYQQRRSDKDCEMGYWEIYEDMSMVFKPIDTPRFRTYEWDELPENETDFWIKLPKPVSLKEGKNNKKFNSKVDRKSLVKSYFKAKSIKSKSKKKLILKYLND